MTCFKKSGFLALLAVVILLQLAQFCQAQNIYVLSENGPDYDKTGKLITFKAGEAQASMIRGCFLANVPESNVAEKRLIFYGTPEWPSFQGANNQHSVGISKHELLGAIESCPAGNNDTIVVYLTAHGGGVGADRHHALLMAEGHENMMDRALILQAVRAKGVRLSVVITDSCAESVAAAPCAVEAMITKITNLFDELFIKASGFVDLNSASPGEYGWTFVFTPTLTSYLTNNASYRMSWSDVVNELREKTDACFKETKSRLLADPTFKQKRPKIYEAIVGQEHQTVWTVTRPLPGEATITTSTAHCCCLKKLIRRIRARRAARRCCCRGCCCN